MSVEELIKPPPLRGDGQGVYRIQVTGNSGTGKSTLARHLSGLLKIPYIPLDEVFWNPGWGQPSSEEFQSRIDLLLEQHNATGWVIDGNYGRRMGPAVAMSRTDCIWLDPPLILYLPRLIYRTFRRLLSLEPNCAPGCEESLSSIFQFNSNSIIWWCITHHGYCREYGNQLLVDDKGIGKVRRIGGWGGELKKWTREVEEMASQSES